MRTPTSTCQAPRKSLRSVLAIVICASAALLTGCGAATVRDDWEPKATVPALPAVYVEVPAAELPRHCGAYSNGVLYGCAKRDFKRKVCTIYTGMQPAAWLLDHERKHCAGYDHGPVTPVGARTAALHQHGSGDNHF